MKKKLIYIILFPLFLSGVATAQISPLPIARVDSAMGSTPKPILILLSTDWCQYCQMQKNQLRKNKEFQKQADQFYYVEFDAESKEKISFYQQEFEYNPSTRLHELAIALHGEDRISFPTWVLLDTAYQVLDKYNGVLTRKHLNEVLQGLKKLKKNKL